MIKNLSSIAAMLLCFVVFQLSAQSTLLIPTNEGGASNKGTVFSIGIDGLNPSVASSFSSASAPRHSLVQASNGYLYGMTYGGGSGSRGVIYRTDLDGTNLTTVYNFTSSTSDGANPYNALIEGSDNKLYGVTSYKGTGSADDKGTVFSINLDGSGYTQLYGFPSHGLNGNGPSAHLTEATDGRLYGVTFGGGANNRGAIFSLNKDGSDFTVEYSLVYETGANPRGGLIQASDGLLYGTLTGGSITGIFSIGLHDSGVPFSNVFIITNPSVQGSNSSSTLIEYNGKFYGVMGGSGANGYGTIFSVDIDGSNYNVLYHFIQSEAQSSSGGLTLFNGRLYGASRLGGASSMGTIYAIDLDGTDFEVLHTFTGGSSDGDDPYFATPIVVSSGEEPAVCEYPSGFAVVNGSDGEADLSWNDFGDGDTYKVRYKKVGTTNWLTASFSGNSGVITGLKSETDYVFAVRTLCVEGGASNYSAEAFLTTNGFNCDVPANRLSSGITSAAATLSWDAQEGATAYKVKYKRDVSSTWQTVSTATNSLNLSNLRAGDNYEWQVRAFCPSGATAYSSTESFSSAEGCGQPANLNTTDVRPRRATFNWDAVAGASYYKVKLITEGKNPRYYKSATNSIIIGNLDLNATYTYQVKAICPAGASTISVNTVTLGAVRFGAFDHGVEELTLYPNPASNQLSVLIPAYQIGGTLKLINANGVVVVTQSVDSEELTLQINEFESGLYMVQITSDNGTEIQRVVIN